MEIINSKVEFETVLKENKSVFVDFYADWCGPCKMLGPVVEELAGENLDVKFIKVNVDNVPEVAQQYGIMSIPALFVIKDGEVAGSTVGFQPKESLQTFVDKVK